MEIYNHNEVYGQNPEPNKNNKPSVYAIVALVLAAVAFVLSCAAFVVTLVRKTPGGSSNADYESVFKEVKSQVVEVRGSNTAATGVVYKIIDGKTYIITNYHVVTGNETARVRFSNYGERKDATVIGYDEYYDIALLETDGYFGSVPVTAGAKPSIGTRVLSVGNNLGYGISATDGIVSLTNRMLTAGGYVRPVYTVTSAINAGMSGGGVFTLDGRIIGIGAYQTESVNTPDGNRDVESTSHCVPYSIASRIAAAILDGYTEQNSSVGQVEKIEIRGSTTEDRLEFWGLYFFADFLPSGLTVNYICYENSTEIAGNLYPQVGDIILSIGDLEIGDDTDCADIFAEILRYEPDSIQNGKPLTVTVKRGDATVNLTYTSKKLKYA